MSAGEKVNNLFAGLQLYIREFTSVRIKAIPGLLREAKDLGERPCEPLKIALAIAEEAIEDARFPVCQNALIV